MDTTVVLIALSGGIPLMATLVLRLSDGGIAERHHSHHDTYVISSALAWTLVFAMIVMGLLGILLGWLCAVGVFEVRPSVVMGFYDAYLVVSFIFWLLLRRYKVITYDDHMEVTPFLGRTASVDYDDISAMEWTPSILMPGSRNVRVFVGHRRRALLWSGLDLDQILIRINRFDALEDHAKL